MVVQATTNLLPVEGMEEDTAPPDQASKPPQPTRSEGEETVGETNVAEETTRYSPLIGHDAKRKSKLLCGADGQAVR